jgi:hypothetical protein
MRQQRSHSTALRGYITHFGPEVVRFTPTGAAAASSEFRDGIRIDLGAPSVTATLNPFSSHFRCH